MKSHLFSGRELIYPTEYDPPEVPNSTGNNNDWGDNDNNGGGIPVMPMTPAHPTAFETRQLGTIFNVEVTGISDDKSIVEMTVVPEIVDFDGFINYGTSLFVPMVSQEKDAKEEVVMVKTSDNFILQPVFSTRRLTAPVRIATGNTLVIGALKNPLPLRMRIKFPFWGIFPGWGAFSVPRGPRNSARPSSSW